MDYNNGEWVLIGGPIIGFHFQGKVTWKAGPDMSLIVGDRCRPKYFGARKLSLRLGEKRQVKFYWQTSHEDYFSVCLSKGLFYAHNTEQLAWVEVFRNNGTASMNPSTDNIYSSDHFLSLTYGSETKVIKFSILQLYNIPTAIDSSYPLITSNFSAVSDTWLPTHSKFKFSDNGRMRNTTNHQKTIMFSEFE